MAENENCVKNPRTWLEVKLPDAQTRYDVALLSRNGLMA